MSTTNGLVQRADGGGRRTSYVRPAGKEFKRTYKACIRCRKSKAKCELPPAADGGLPEGPCVKCRRERKLCEFTATRSIVQRRKRTDSVPDLSVGYQGIHDGGANSSSIDVTQRSAPFNHASRSYHPMSHNQDFPPGVTQDGNHTTESGPVSEGNDLSDINNYSSPIGQGRTQRSAIDDRVMRTIVTSSNDALGLLFQAVEERNPAARRDSQGRRFDGESDSDNLRGHGSPNQHRTPRSVFSASMSAQNPPEQLSSPTPELLKLWNRCRFVKQGWFSAREAITYIDL